MDKEKLKESLIDYFKYKMRQIGNSDYSIDNIRIFEEENKIYALADIKYTWWLRNCMGKKRRFSANHAFSQIVFCAECGETFKRLHWNNRGRKYIVWRCSSRLHDNSTCSARTVREDVLQEAFLEAVNQIVGNSREYLRVLQQNLELAIKQVNDG